MQKDKSKFTVKALEACEMLKVPKAIFHQWRIDGVLDGVPHPEFKKTSGQNVLYSVEGVNSAKAALPNEDYYPKANVELTRWSPTDVCTHGRASLLAQAKNGSAVVTLRSGVRYKISASDEFLGSAASARDILGRNMARLGEVDRIYSRDMFPGTEFVVEKIGGE